MYNDDIVGSILDLQDQKIFYFQFDVYVLYLLAAFEWVAGQIYIDQVQAFLESSHTLG